MRPDWRRQILQLPPTGKLSQAAVRAAYWRLHGVATDQSLDWDRLREAKRQLLFEAGLRIPMRGR